MIFSKVERVEEPSPGELARLPKTSTCGTCGRVLNINWLASAIDHEQGLFAAIALTRCRCGTDVYNAIGPSSVVLALQKQLEEEISRMAA